MDQQYKTSNVTNPLNILFKHKFKFLFVFLATLTTVTIGTFMLEPIYEARATLLVKPGREFAYTPEVGDGRVSLPFRYEEIINSEIRILTSSDLLEKVVNGIGIDELYPSLLQAGVNYSEAKPTQEASGAIDPTKLAVLQFQGNLSVSGISKSNLIDIGFQHQDPQIAAKAVDHLVDLFKEKHLEVFSSTKSPFFENQLALYQKKLQESERNLEAFKQKNQIVSYEDQKRLLLRQRMELDSVMKASTNKLKELENKYSYLVDQLTSIPEDISLYKETTVQNDSLIDRGRTKLLELELKEKELLQQFDESVPLVVNVREQIHLVKEFLAKQENQLKETVRTGKNQLYQEIESQKIAVEAELNSLKVKNKENEAQIKQLDVKMATLKGFERKLKNLIRDKATAERNYQAYLGRYEEAKISEEMDRQKLTNISVIQAATVPLFPIRPRKKLNVMLGAVFGIIIGLVVVFCSEFLGSVQVAGAGKVASHAHPVGRSVPGLHERSANRLDKNVKDSDEGGPQFHDVRAPSPELYETNPRYYARHAAGEGANVGELSPNRQGAVLTAGVYETNPRYYARHAAKEESSSAEAYPASGDSRLADEKRNSRVDDRLVSPKDRKVGSEVGVQSYATSKQKEEVPLSKEKMIDSSVSKAATREPHPIMHSGQRISVGHKKNSISEQLEDANAAAEDRSSDLKMKSLREYENFVDDEDLKAAPVFSKEPILSSGVAKNDSGDHRGSIVSRDLEVAKPLATVRGSGSQMGEKLRGLREMYSGNESLQSEQAFENLQRLASKTYKKNVKHLDKRLRKVLKDVPISYK